MRTSVPGSSDSQGTSEGVSASRPAPTSITVAKSRSSYSINSHERGAFGAGGIGPAPPSPPGALPPLGLPPLEFGVPPVPARPPVALLPALPPLARPPVPIAPPLVLLAPPVPGLAPPLALTLPPLPPLAALPPVTAAVPPLPPAGESSESSDEHAANPRPNTTSESARTGFMPAQDTPASTSVSPLIQRDKPT